MTIGETFSRITKVLWSGLLDIGWNGPGATA